MPGVASTIYDALALRMVQLGFEESNAAFDPERIGQTVRDRSFMISFDNAVPDFDRGSFCKKFSVERLAKVTVFYRMNPGHSGEGIKEVLRDAYDKEEEIISSILAVRVDSLVDFETVDSIETKPENNDSGEWLVTTVNFRMKYRITL